MNFSCVFLWIEISTRLIASILLCIQVIEYCDKRFASEEEGTSKVEGLVQLVAEILPPPPMPEEETSNQEEPSNLEEASNREAAE